MTDQFTPAPELTPASAIKSVLRKYAVFTGRASRSEFWWWFLLVAVVVMIAGIIFAVTEDATVIVGVAGFICIWILATLLPTIAVLVRRLRDGGTPRSPYWVVLVIFGGLLFAALGLAARPPVRTPHAFDVA